MRAKKKDNRKKLYIPLSDIEKINNDFLNEMERVKARLSNVQDKQIIEAFHEVLLTAYKAAIEIKALECEVDYDIKFAEIEQRRRNLKPWRRCWLWRLLFQPLTNRAQDIIEDRAEVDADIIHTAAEKATDKEREKLLSDKDIKVIKNLMQDKLNEVIKEADKSDINEAFKEPPEVVRTNTVTAAPMRDDKPTQEPPKEQLSMNIMPPAGARRPRPPRSCRK